MENLKIRTLANLTIYEAKNAAGEFDCVAQYCRKMRSTTFYNDAGAVLHVLGNPCAEPLSDEEHDELVDKIEKRRNLRDERTVEGIFFPDTLELDTAVDRNLSLAFAVDPATGERGDLVFQYDDLTDTTTFFALGSPYIIIEGDVRKKAIQYDDVIQKLDEL